MAAVRGLFVLLGPFVLLSAPPAASEPFDLGDPTPRLVAVDIDRSANPAIVGRVFTPGITTPAFWTSDGEIGVIRWPGNAVESWIVAATGEGPPRAGTFSDWVTEIDVATGDVIASRFRGSFESDPLPPVGPERAREYFATTIPGTWEHQDGVPIPGMMPGVQFVEVPVILLPEQKATIFCTEIFGFPRPFEGCGQVTPFNRGWVAVEPFAYDPETGLLNAPGLFSVFATPLFSGAGDWRLSEVEDEIGGPVDLSDPTPRIVAIEIEQSPDPGVTGASPEAIWSAPQLASWTTDGDVGTIGWTARPRVERLERGGLPMRDPPVMPPAQPEPRTHVDRVTGHILAMSGYDAAFPLDVADGAYFLTTLGIFESPQVGQFEGSLAGYEQWPVAATQGDALQLVSLFCTDVISSLSPGEMGCQDAGYGSGFVAALPYDPGSGRVVATGPMREDGLVLFDRSGDQRWSEVVVTLTVPEPGAGLATLTVLLGLLGTARLREPGPGTLQP